MARCRHFNVLSMVTEFPLLMANGNFKYLDCMQDQELESFLSYLIRYCSEKYFEDPTTKPEWWGNEVKFFNNFYTGVTSLPYIKNKQMKLRRIIQSCYAYYDSQHLLVMSEKLASRLVYDFEKNSDDTITVNIANTKTPLVVIPASNLDYDLSRVPGQLMNSGLKRQVLSGPVKKASMIPYDCRTIVAVDDSDSDSDCIIIDDVSSDDETASTPSRNFSNLTTSDEEYQEYFDHDKFIKPRNRRRNEEGLACVDLTLDEDDEERRAILEAAKARFLEQFRLVRRGATPSDLQPTPPPKEQKRKSKFSLKKFSLDQVPFLVRIGLLPRRCMITINEITVRTGSVHEEPANQKPFISSVGSRPTSSNSLHS